MRILKELRDHPILAVLIIVALLISGIALHRPQSAADKLLSSCWEGSVMGGDHEVPCSDLPPSKRPQPLQ